MNRLSVLFLLATVLFAPTPALADGGGPGFNPVYLVGTPCGEPCGQVAEQFQFSETITGYGCRGGDVCYLIEVPPVPVTFKTGIALCATQDECPAKPCQFSQCSQDGLCEYSPMPADWGCCTGTADCGAGEVCELTGNGNNQCIPDPDVQVCENNEVLDMATGNCYTQQQFTDTFCEEVEGEVLSTCNLNADCYDQGQVCADVASTTGHGVCVDPVFDMDPGAGNVCETSADCLYSQWGSHCVCEPFNLGGGWTNECTPLCQECVQEDWNGDGIDEGCSSAKPTCTWGFMVGLADDEGFPTKRLMYTCQ